MGTEKEVANVILNTAGPGDRFYLKWFGITFKLSIKPLTCKQIIVISGELSRIRDVDPTKELFPALVEHSSDSRHVAKAIAIATGTLFRRIVTRAILQLPLQDVETLFKILRKQSDAERFFFIITLAKGLDKLTKKKEEKPRK